MAASYKDPNDAVALGVKLRVARKERGKTLKNLENETGISHAQISRIERGKSKSASKNVQIICTFLDVKATPYNSNVVEGQQLALRLERIASSSPKWMNVVRAIAEALEDAQNNLAPRN